MFDDQAKPDRSVEVVWAFSGEAELPTRKMASRKKLIKESLVEELNLLTIFGHNYTPIFDHKQSPYSQPAKTLSEELF
jgi:hypothetical protein